MTGMPASLAALSWAAIGAGSIARVMMPSTFWPTKFCIACDRTLGSPLPSATVAFQPIADAALVAVSGHV
jgi:hypothetical protein